MVTFSPSPSAGPDRVNLVSCTVHHDLCSNLLAADTCRIQRQSKWPIDHLISTLEAVKETYIQWSKYLYM